MSRRTKAASQHKPASYRADIQGLRAVAVSLVLVYHAGASWLPGGFVGVDVFFVISGFLITGGIVRELRETGRLSIRGFYARRVARILPASIVALIGVLLMTWLLLPQTRWSQVGQDVFASGLYYVNWLFANSSVDYLARDAAPSPVQHFWSLAVEEQFYIVWPVLLLMVATAARKRRADMQRAFMLALVAVLVPSLAWSIYLTETNPGVAYFVTTTRMWELAIGAALAIAAGRTRKAGPAVAAAVGWIGLAAIAFSGVVFTTALPFPSYTALLPTVGAAAVIWAGFDGVRGGPGMILGQRPAVVIGELSYSLYLWHWPLLVVAASLLGGPLEANVGFLVVAIAFIPAWLSLRLVEVPVQSLLKQDKTENETVGVGIVMTLFSLVCALVLVLAIPPTPPASAVSFTPTPVMGTEAEPIGAETILADLANGTPRDAYPSITPSPVAAVQDLPNACLQSSVSVEAVACSFGDRNSQTVIALVGDSHAAMLVPGFARVAQDNGWRLDVYTKGACPFSAATVNLDGKPFLTCDEWVKNVTNLLMSKAPNAIVTAATEYTVVSESNGTEDTQKAAMAVGIRDAWKPFLAQGIDVITVRDAPRPGVLVPDCVAKNEKALTQCAMLRQDILPATSAQVIAAEGVNGAHVVDLTNAICPTTSCPAVIGGVLIYRDGNHLTATYAATMHGQIQAQLQPIIRQ